MTWVGTWKNEYGSLLKITSDENGNIEGWFRTALPDSGFYGQSWRSRMATTIALALSWVMPISLPCLASARTAEASLRALSTISRPSLICLRIVHCVLINYPAREERAWDGIVTRISLSLKGE
jgi:hypothetical protein